MKKKETEFVRGVYPSNDKLIEFMDENHLNANDILFWIKSSKPTIKKWLTGKSMIPMWRVVEIIKKLTEKMSTNNYAQ